LTCCVTGHRPQGLPWGFDEDDDRCDALRRHLRQTVKELYGRGFRRFICGMALGVDMMFAEAVFGELPPEAAMEAAIPCPSQPSAWPALQRERYRSILERCAQTHMLSPSYTPMCMQLRNEWMVAQSGVVVAVWNGSPHGGTYRTLEYARRLEREIILIRV
jgi:uncharacterized phage-like protein YoqJ